jgi:hypothetical protein
MLAHTSTRTAPWYVVPADHKWFTRLAVAAILWQRLEDLDLAFPKITKAKAKELQDVRRMLLAEAS